jgi:GNAT superfamily N-acetyltransferase
LYVLGTTTVESHRIGTIGVEASADGTTGLLVADGSAAQIAVAGDELIVTEKSGAVARVPLRKGAVSGAPPMRCQLMYRIATARPSDLPQLPAIELAAATLLAGYAPASVLVETTTQVALEAAQRRGRLWVALADGVPVGFAHVEVLERDTAHLEEIDVHPEHGRRGLGRRLVIAVCRWAAANGYWWVTLTTFRDVPWNMPFYARLGFEEIPPEQLSPALLCVIEDETLRGLDPRRRVVMRRSCLLAAPADGHAEHTS